MEIGEGNTEKIVGGLIMMVIGYTLGYFLCVLRILSILGFLLFTWGIFSYLNEKSPGKSKTQNNQKPPKIEKTQRQIPKDAPPHLTHSCPECNSAFIVVYEDGSGFCHQCGHSFQNAKPNK